MVMSPSLFSERGGELLLPELVPLPHSIFGYSLYLDFEFLLAFISHSLIYISDLSLNWELAVEISLHCSILSGFTCI